MKRAMLFLGILILALFLLGCNKGTNFVCPNGNIVDDPSACGTETDLPVEDQEVPTSEENVADTTDAIPDLPMAPKVQELINKGLNMQSFSYMFKDLQKPKEATTYQYNVKGNLVKRYLPFTTNILYKNDYDMIIFNRETKVAVAYCERKEYCTQTGEYGTVNYEEFYVDTHLDWLERIKTAELLSASEEVFGRATWKLVANDGEFTIWIESYYGAPLKVQKGDLGYEFREPKFNTLTDKDVAYEEKLK